MRVPDRRLEPPEPAPPVSSCWYCNEPLYGDSVLTIGGYDCCGNDECVEAIGLEIAADLEYEDLDDDFTFVDYVLGEYGEYKHIPTQEEMEMEKAEMKMEEEKLKEDGYA